MKVLLIGSVYPRSAGDSEVPWLRETVNRLWGRGVEVEVLVPSWKGQKNHTIDGAPVHRFRYAPAQWEFLTHDEGAPNKLRKMPWLKLLAFPYLISGALQCFVLTWRKKYSVLHVHWPFPHVLIGIVSAKLLRKPMILTFHGAELAMARHSWIARKTIAWGLRHAVVVTANSSYTKRLIQEIRPVEVEILPYGSSTADSPAGKADGSEEKTGNGLFRVLFVGRHVERKGVPHLIEATRHFPADFSWELVIAGSGDQTERWKALAGEAGGRIRFTGKVDADVLQGLYTSADAFVLPAVIDSSGDTEGLGVVLLEAIEAGVPVIASAVGGIVDVIRHEETGLLVPPGEPEQLAEAILQIHDNKDLAAVLASRAAEHARKLYHWDSLIDRWIAVYRSILNRSP